MIGVSFAWLFTVGVLRVPFVFSVKLLSFFWKNVFLIFKCLEWLENFYEKLYVI